MARACAKREPKRGTAPGLRLNRATETLNSFRGKWPSDILSEELIRAGLAAGNRVALRYFGHGAGTGDGENLAELLIVVRGLKTSGALPPESSALPD